MIVEIIAELGNSHNGSLDRAHVLIDAAKAAGVDAVKFQCYTPSELVALRGDGPAPEPWGSDGWSMRDLYEKAQTPHAWFPELVEHCTGIGLPWFSSVFGPESLALLQGLGCPRYKLASLDFACTELRDMVAATGKPLIVSCSKPKAPKIDAALLWCPPGYPQPAPKPEGVSHGYDGYSYHGTDWLLPPMAVRLGGARLVEFHFHLRYEPNELEAACCLDEFQVPAMVRAIRLLEGA